MSNEKLLNEATIRRFMKLANMEPLTSPFVDRLDEMHCPSGGRDDDEPMEEDKDYTAKKEKPGADLRHGAEKRGAEGTLAKTPGHGKDDFVNEDEEEERELDATEDELGDMDAEADRERDELDDLEADDADGDIPADVRDRIEDALAAALEDLADKLDLDLDVEREDDDAPEMMDAAPEAEVAVDVDDDDDAVEVDAMLENVEVVDDTDLINEVAKRVTARLVKAMAKK